MRVCRSGGVECVFLKTSDVHTKIKPESHMHYEGQPMVFVKMYENI